MSSATRQSSVNFGSHATGLSTVGYTLYDFDGTVKQSRATDNVTEIGSSGIYCTSFSIDTGWTGIVLWDTGEATPTYAQDEKFSQLNKIQDQADYIRIIFNTIRNRAEYEGTVLRKLEKVLESTNKVKEETVNEVTKNNRVNENAINSLTKTNDANLFNVSQEVSQAMSIIPKLVSSIKDHDKDLNINTIKEIKRISESLENAVNYKTIKSIVNNASRKIEGNSNKRITSQHNLLKMTINKDITKISNLIKELEFKLKTIQVEIKRLGKETGVEFDESILNKNILPFKIFAGK